MMETDPMEKDPAVIDVVRRLIGRAGSTNVRVNDHWEIDLCAVGISRPGEDRPLVYITTRDMPTGRYWVELEAPTQPGSDAPYTKAGTFEDVDFEELFELARRFLRIPESR